MENKEKDILNCSPELKRMPFSVPEGYFDDLRRSVAVSNGHRSKQVSVLTKLIPYASMAAMLLFALVLGRTLADRRQTVSETTDTVSEFEDFMVFADGSTDVALYYLEHEQYAENNIEEDEIIEYLIYTGVSEMDIELLK